jgi:glycosyltransferase involved in cell wall biosynthesis
MRVLFFWEPAGLSLDKANPYGGLLAGGMRALGQEFEPGFREHLTPAFLEAHRGAVGALHVNWPSSLYADPDSRIATARAAELLSGLNHARSLGMKVVWTMHNLYPHESALPELDRLVRLGITDCADAIIVHCEHSRALLRRHFFRESGVVTIPHGNFIAPYPNTVTRAEARARLGIDPGIFVYLFFGSVRPNKGLDQLVEAFQRLPAQDCLLLVGARVYHDASAAAVDRIERADPRVRIHRSRFYANDEFQLFYNAADVAVFPFTDVLTSGSAITALSLGCPVVVPAIGCLTELVDSRIGLTYDPTRPDSLLRALQQVRNLDLPSCRTEALTRMRKLDWTGIARRTLDVYGIGS